jgi:hypothetical protein
MKHYHVTIQVKDSAPRPNESNAALLRMELLITLGDDARHVPVGAVNFRSTPTTIDDLIKGTLADLRLTDLMDIREVDEITEEDMEHYAYNT